jgi:capsular exopolysaccharide synthesis family protein
MAAGLQQTTNPVIGQFFQTRAERDQLTRDREAIERAVAQGGDSGPNPDALRFIAVVKGSQLENALNELTLKEADLRAHRYKYSEEYPPLQRLVADVRTLRTQTIPGLAAQLTAQIATQEQELDRRINAASAELRQIPQRSIEEGRLQRSVTSADQIYTTLRQKYEQSRIAELESRPDVRILDEAAVPQRPVTNIASRFILLGLLAGLGMGVGLAILLDRVDSRVRYPEQVSRDMGLTILGAVPRVRGNGNGKGNEAVQVVEALRGVRLNLAHAYGSAGPILVTVSSPGSGDGKSFIASNLALAFADAGHKTLLLDGDIRRGALHRVMHRERKPGLTDFLSGKATREQILHPTSYPQLGFIPCGTRTQAGPELLGSAAMRDLVTGLRAHYGVIIVDSPPLGAGVDAYALSTWTGNLVMVLRTGATDRQFTEAKLEVLDRLPVRVLGAVLNGVKEWNVYRYYAYYLPGYEHEEDEAAGAGGKLLGGETKGA